MNQIDPALNTPRRDARERALTFLYEAESRGCPVAEVIDALPLPPEQFTIDIVTGVEENLPTIDELLNDYAHGWTVDRMAALDRHILRIGVYELAHRPDVPRNVVLNEAVELASQYSTEKSSKFVNGILSAAAEELRDQKTVPETKSSV